jgi:hypothetical protein
MSMAAAVVVVAAVTTAAAQACLPAAPYVCTYHGDTLQRHRAQVHGHAGFTSRPTHRAHLLQASAARTAWARITCRPHLLLLLSLVVGNVEVPQLVRSAVLAVRNHTQPVAHVVLLQVLLRQVLEIALGHVPLAGHSDLALVTRHLDSIAKHAGLAIHLDFLGQELLKGGNLHDLVLDWLSTVDGEGQRLRAADRPWDSSSEQQQQQQHADAESTKATTVECIARL